jgi:CRP-like cAMP-binding protein
MCRTDAGWRLSDRVDRWYVEIRTLFAEFRITGPISTSQVKLLAVEGGMQAIEQCFSDATRRSVTRPTVQPAPPDALVLLEQFGTTISVKRDRQIYSQDDEADCCYKILSGCVRIVNFMEDGRRQIDQFLMAGKWLGFDDLETHDFGAEAVTGVVLRCFPRRAVDKLAESSIGLTRRLRDMTAISLRMAHARLKQLDRTPHRVRSPYEPQRCSGPSWPDHRDGVPGAGAPLP